MSAQLPDEIDVLVIGAGLSGINAAYRLHESCPDLTYAMVEARDDLGGTWDLFRYPGIRSDSDFYTLALPFFPWEGRDAIVSGGEILDYLHRACRRFGIDRHLHLRTRVVAADFDRGAARWAVRVSTPDGEREVRAGFLVMCTGYYDYEHPFDAQIPGLADFAGQVVHPQQWPDDLEVSGRRVAVIGSGATAITLVPALADLGARVTMMQRTPSYVLAQPRRDPLAVALRRVMPAARVNAVMRVKNTAAQWALVKACQAAPQTMRKLLRKGAIAGIGSAAVADAHFTPPYDPWAQRLCIAPEGDFFTAIRDGRAEVVTGRIERVETGGIRVAPLRSPSERPDLRSPSERQRDEEFVPADIIVTATGLAIKVLDGIALSVDGEPVDIPERITYLGAMLDGVPNAAFCLGYINLSWTMRSDMTARLIARILRRMVDDGFDTVVPRRPTDLGELRPIMDMQSGYLARGAALMPRAASAYPWTMQQDFVRDARATNRADLAELHWSAVSTKGER